jgi:hypothetical protein
MAHRVDWTQGDKPRLSMQGTLIYKMPERCVFSEVDLTVSDPILAIGHKTRVMGTTSHGLEVPKENKM